MAVVVADPYSTGGRLPILLSERGFDVIALWTAEARDLEDHVGEATRVWIEKTGYKGVVREGTMTIEEIAKALKAAAGKESIKAVLCGGESGVNVVDALAEHMHLPGNGVAPWTGGRRDKGVQQDALRATGIRAVRGVSGTTWSGAVEEFCKTEEMPIVLKPVESAGSDGVKLCATVEEAEDHFRRLMNSQRALGAHGAAVIAQEFLKGSEYVVDHVTKDGTHKTMMVWKYDKRPRNGSQFVYFGMYPVNPVSAIAQSLIQYTRCAITALKITNGATHTEVMMTSEGPCLVEVNCRVHGLSGQWLPLASALTGSYNQCTAYVDSALDPEAWEKIPPIPPYPFAGSGCVVEFVSYCEGTVAARPGYEAIRALRSFCSLDEVVKVGDRITKTIDLFTQPGNCILIHTDEEVLAKDVAAIRALEESNGMFDIEGGNPPPLDDRELSAIHERGSKRISKGDRHPAMLMGDTTEMEVLMAQVNHYIEELEHAQKKHSILAMALAATACALGACVLHGAAVMAGRLASTRRG